MLPWLFSLAVNICAILTLILFLPHHAVPIILGKDGFFLEKPSIGFSSYDAPV